MRKINDAVKAFKDLWHCDRIRIKFCHPTADSISLVGEFEGLEDKQYRLLHVCCSGLHNKPVEYRRVYANKFLGEIKAAMESGEIKI